MNRGGRPKKWRDPPMPRKPPNFHRSDLQRAIVGVREEGLDIERVEVAKDGGFVIHTGKLEITNVEDAAKQAWQRATEELQTKPKTKTPKGKQARR
jgi:hypothetical protein